MKRAIRITLLALACLAVAAPVFAARIDACGKLPAPAREAGRTLAYCITLEGAAAECRQHGIDLQVFDNDENRLPRAGRGQAYYEGKARQADGSAGTDRFVYLVTEGSGKKRVEERYYTADHYQRFCEL